MPRIDITEIEQSSLSPQLATSHAVFIPILTTNTELKMKQYDSFTRFVEDFGEKTVNGELIKGYVNVKQGSSTTVDKSYIYAIELLYKGLKIVVLPVFVDSSLISDDTVDYQDACELIWAELEKTDVMNLILSKNLFDIKFITTGGYPNCVADKPVLDEDGNPVKDEEDNPVVISGTAVYKKLAQYAGLRGDCVALIEFEEDISNILEAITGGVITTTTKGEYATACYPHCEMNLSAVYSNLSTTTYIMPASFAYLSAYANSIKTNPSWFSPAGVLRGVIPNLVKPIFDLSEYEFDYLQGKREYSGGTLNVCVNAIMKLHNYGYRMLGNRTLNMPAIPSEPEFKNFLNIRVLLCDLKKRLYAVSTRLTYEPNDDIAMVQLRTLTNDLLDKMKSTRGIRFYKWENVSKPAKATLTASLTIRPIEAIEDFNISVLMTDETTNIEEI